MPKLRVHNITISLDGFAAGPDQRPEYPLGEGFGNMHEWMFAAMRDQAEGRTGIDGYRVAELVGSPAATHARLVRR